MRSNSDGSGDHKGTIRQQPGFVDGKVGAARTGEKEKEKREERSSWTQGLLELQKSRTARVETFPFPEKLVQRQTVVFTPSQVRG